MNAQPARSRLILGIESSCDDTAAALIRLGPTVEVLSSIVVGQAEAHAPFGGVVPEIAARAHAQRLDHVVERAMAEAGEQAEAIDAIAATAGPGLIGGVMAGLTFAKGMAMALNVPLVPVNHLAGHALSIGLEAPLHFPYLLLLVSGGHTQLLRVDGVGAYQRLGTTIDDAAGEAFDKTAKLLELEGAGGPAVQALAEGGDASAFDLPRPLLGRPGCDFSFSGLKTAVRQLIETIDRSADADIAASFQVAAVRHLLERTAKAMQASEGAMHLVAAGGVASNTHLRAGLEALTAEHGWALTVPPLRFCTDNAAMIALAGGLDRQARGASAVDQDFSFAPRARWPLDEGEFAVTLGSGRKGRKA